MTYFPALEWLIGGSWSGGSSQGHLDIINPANEEAIARLPLCGAGDIDRALEAASEAFESWRHVPARERAQILENTARLIRDRKEHLAQVLTMEQGKPLAEARVELERTAETFSWYANEAIRAYGRIIAGRLVSQRHEVVPEPVGVVAGFTPWNFPAVLAARKIAPAIGAGCTIILKASERCPGIAVMLFKLLEEAGAPPGVVNLIFGDPEAVSRHLMASPVIRKITFTGSTEVGIHLAKRAAENLQRSTLELGGHTPVIVCDDADWKYAADVTADVKFKNAGQACNSPTRFFVHRSCYEQFSSRFSNYAQALKVGPGTAPNTEMGPVTDFRRLEAMQAFVTDALARGANCVAGGERLDRKGFFWAPTVVTEPDPQSDVMKAEPFGPIALITPFDDLDEAIARANSLPYGLAACCFTRSMVKARKLASELQCGGIGVNMLSSMVTEAPVGGMKMSGSGYEGGHEGIEDYFHRKLVSIDIAGGDLQ